MINRLKNTFPVGSPMWILYRSLRLKCRPLAHGNVLHGNILLRNVQAIYLWIPKVACSTLKKVCADYLDLAAEAVDLAETVHRIEFPYVKKYQVRSKYQAYYKFAFVRNPWDRLVSCYRDKICDEAEHVYDRHENRFVQYLQTVEGYSPGMTFEDFVELVARIPDAQAEGHLRSQASFLSDRDGLLPLDKVGRFEILAEDFEIIAKRIGLTCSLPHLRASGRRDYRDYYSAKTRELVRERYANDLAHFPYDF